MAKQVLTNIQIEEDKFSGLFSKVPQVEKSLQVAMIGDRSFPSFQISNISILKRLQFPALAGKALFNIFFPTGVAAGVGGFCIAGTCSWIQVDASDWNLAPGRDTGSFCLT